jgi:5-carboxyvanillate decarboxylase
MLEPYADHGLIGPMWGYNAAASIHLLRLILRGAFDRLPRVRVAVGHLGEGIPYYFERIDEWYGLSEASPRLRQPPSGYFRDSIFVTTSGMNRSASLAFCHSVLGAGRIMFAADYPQEPRGGDRSDGCAPIPAADKPRIYGLNARELFDL